MRKNLSGSDGRKSCSRHFERSEKPISPLEKNCTSSFLCAILNADEGKDWKIKNVNRKIIRIPLPEFYVLYNGSEKLPAVSEKRLSETFMKEDGDTAQPSLELVVKVYNINAGVGDELLKKCSVLRQYTSLIDLPHRVFAPMSQKIHLPAL